MSDWQQPAWTSNQLLSAASPSVLAGIPTSASQHPRSSTSQCSSPIQQVRSSDRSQSGLSHFALCPDDGHALAALAFSCIDTGQQGTRTEFHKHWDGQILIDSRRSPVKCLLPTFEPSKVLAEMQKPSLRCPSLEQMNTEAIFSNTVQSREVLSGSDHIAIWQCGACHAYIVIGLHR